jgi:hypothetical protein
MPALRRPSITRSQAARTRGSALAGGESACAALMVFVNESELPWDFWSSQRCDSYGHARTAKKPYIWSPALSHLSLNRLGWAGCCATSISEKSEPVPN